MQYVAGSHISHGKTYVISLNNKVGMLSNDKMMKNIFCFIPSGSINDGIPMEYHIGRCRS